MKKYIVICSVVALLAAGCTSMGSAVDGGSFSPAQVASGIQATPMPAATLEFKTESADPSTAGSGTAWLATGLTGKQVASATTDFQKNDSIVVIRFNSEGRDLFAKLTKDNMGKRIAIFIDGQLVSAPAVQSTITDGVAIIAGGFTPQQAKDLAARIRPSMPGR